MLNKVRDYIREQDMAAPGDAVIVALSGGADSVCLLTVMKRLDFALRAVHVHHGIRGAEADRDEVFVRNLCERFSVPLFVAHCQVPAYAAEHGLSEEEAGRILRYRILEEEAEKWEQELSGGGQVKIALAHHRDDNAETILHHLLRGSGLTGLAGIRPLQGRRIRPFLCVGRDEIRSYLTAEHIEQFEKDPGLRPWTSVLPMVLIILLINLFGMDLSYAVLAGTVLALLLGWKNLPDKLRTFNEGVAKVGPAMVTTAASVGFGGAVLACTGAQTILETIASLPVNPTISLSLAASFAGILTGNGGGGADVAMNILSGQYLAMGVQPEILHRVVAIATAGFSCLPHNGMLITVSDTCGFSAKECYRYIFVSTVLVSLAGLLVTVGLGCVLYPVG